MSGVVAALGMSVAVNRSTLAWAVAESVARGAELTLLHQWRSPVEVSVRIPPGVSPALPDGAVSQATDRFDASLQAHRPDLIVMGHNGAAHHLHRFTRARLADPACPIAVIPEGAAAPVRRIVVAGQGCADDTDCALAWATAEAHRRCAELEVLRPGRRSRHGLAAGEAKRTLERREAGSQRRSSCSGKVLISETPFWGGPLDALLEAADRADVLVVSHDHHSAFGKIVHADLASDLIPHVACVVVSVPQGSAHDAA